MTTAIEAPPTLRRLLKAVIATVKAHRAMLAASKGPPPSAEQLATLRRDLGTALKALDAASVAYKPDAKASPGFDWIGAGRAVMAGFELLQKVKTAKTDGDVAEVFETIDVEVIDARSVPRGARRG